MRDASLADAEPGPCAALGRTGPAIPNHTRKFEQTERGRYLKESISQIFFGIENDPRNKKETRNERNHNSRRINHLARLPLALYWHPISQVSKDVGTTSDKRSNYIR